MLQPIYQNKFKKDLEKVAKRGKDLRKIKAIMAHLIANKPLDKKYLDHSLKGEYSGCHGRHLEPDWLLIYLIENNSITFIRIGTHADLFR